MTDKVLCPWCGEEMWKPDTPWERGQPEMGGYVYTMQGKCRHCGAMTPRVYGRTPKEAVENYFAVALRHYEPPVRPLMPEEIDPRKYRTLFTEYRDVAGSGWDYASDLCKVACIYGDTYGKTWRCWPRKPTDEEREAYEWEDEKE